MLSHEEEHEEAETLLDWFLLSFHENLGHDHLECYSKYEHPDMVSNFQLSSLEPFIVCVCPKIVLVEKLSFVYTSDFSFLIEEKLPSSYYYHPNTALRAPPQYT